MLNLKVYSGRDIQNAIAILTQLYRIRKDMTIGEGLYVLKTNITSSIKEPEVPVSKDKRYIGKRIKKIKCPSCKKGYLLPTPNNEGLNIVSCKKCRYSMILEEEIENGK